MIYYIVILVVCLFAFIFSKYKRMVVAFSIVLFSLFAGTRLDIDNDYFFYEYLFKYKLTLSQFRSLNVEYCIYIVNKLSRLFFYSKTDNIFFSFLFFAVLGVSTKMIAISRYSINVFLSIIIYGTYLFLMQEMTTIRAGVASGLFLLSIVYLVNKNYLWYSVFMAVSFLFHNSSVLFILVALIIFFEFKIKYLYFAFAASFLIILTNQNLLQLLFLDRIFPRVATYLEISTWSGDDNINIFNFKILISLLFTLLFAVNFKKMEADRWFNVLFRIHLISLIIFFSLSTTAMVFSARSFDLLSVNQILLYPYVLLIFKNKFAVFGWLIIIVSSLLQLFYLVDVSEIYKPYQSWLF